MVCSWSKEVLHIWMTREFTSKTSIMPSCSRTGHLDPCPNTFCCNLTIVNSEFLLFHLGWFLQPFYISSIKCNTCLPQNVWSSFWRSGKRHLPYMRRKDINCSIICNILKDLHLLISQYDWQGTCWKAMRILFLLFQADNNLTSFLWCLDLEYTMGNRVFILVTVINLQYWC